MYGNAATIRTALARGPGTAFLGAALMHSRGPGTGTVGAGSPPGLLGGGTGAAREKGERVTALREAGKEEGGEERKGGKKERKGGKRGRKERKEGKKEGREGRKERKKGLQFVEAERQLIRGERLACHGRSTSLTISCADL